MPQNDKAVWKKKPFSITRHASKEDGLKHLELIYLHSSIALDAASLKEVNITSLIWPLEWQALKIKHAYYSRQII